MDVAGWTSVHASQLRVDATEAGAEATRQDLLALVGARFVEAQRAAEAHAAAESLLARSERLAALAEDRVAVGVAAPIEAKRAQVQRAADAQRVLAARLDRDASLLRLAEILGTPLGEGIEVAPARALEPGDGGGTLEDRPDLRAARGEAEAATVDRRAAARSFAPELNGFASTGVGAILGTAGSVVGAGTIGVTGTEPVYSASAGIQATFSILDGGFRSANLRASRAAETTAALAAGNVERRATVDLDITARTVENAGLALDAARLLSELSTAEVALAEDRFASGAATNVEVVDAQSRLAAALLAEVDALAAWNRAVIAWYQSRGRLSELALPE